MAKDQKAQNSPVTGTVPAPLREAIEDYRWKNRMTVSDVVREAFEVWVREQGISTPDDAPAELPTDERTSSRARK